MKILYIYVVSSVSTVIETENFSFSAYMALPMK